MAPLALAGGQAPASGPATVALYLCEQCAQPPVADGRLDDLCWQGLPMTDAFYQYWTPIPKPPPLKTAARACYDDSGLYLGIALSDEHIGTLRAAIHDRDNPLTWTDDCVEIMVDPTNSGSSYLKFCTNLNAARYDERSADLVLDGGWNVEGWQVATSRNADSWTIEFALPWSDVGASPRDGDIWSFDLVRYSFSTGGFPRGDLVAGRGRGAAAELRVPGLRPLLDRRPGGPRAPGQRGGEDQGNAHPGAPA